MLRLSVWIILLLFAYPPFALGLLPIRNPDHSVNIDSLAEHMTDVETILNGILTGQHKSNDSELVDLKAELADLKIRTESNEKELAAAKAELESLKKHAFPNVTDLTAELAAVKSDLESDKVDLKLVKSSLMGTRTEVLEVESKLASVETQNKSEHTMLMAEVASLRADITALENRTQSGLKEIYAAKTEVLGVKAELRLAEDDIHLLQQQLKDAAGANETATLAKQVQILSSNAMHLSHLNMTVIDHISRDVKKNTREIEDLKLSVNNTSMCNCGEIELELQALLTRQNVTEKELEGTLALSELTEKRLKQVDKELAVHTNTTMLEILQAKQDTALELHATQVMQNSTHEELERTLGLTELALRRLEKLEIEVTDMSNSSLPDVTEGNHDIASRLEVLEQKVNHTATEVKGGMETMYSLVGGIVNHSNAEIAGLKTSLETKLETVKDICNSSVMDVLNTTSASIDALDHHIHDPRPDIRFRVTGPSGNKPLIFDHIDYNEGQGYNKTNGVFTAPVSGNYLFWFDGYSHASSDHTIAVHKDKSILEKIHVNNVHILHALYLHHYLGTIVTHLKSGQQIHLSTDDDVRDDFDTFFLGTLL